MPNNNMYSSTKCGLCGYHAFITGPKSGGLTYNKLCINCHVEWYDTGLGMMYVMPNRLDRISEIYNEEITEEDRERAEKDPPPVDVPVPVREQSEEDVLDSIIKKPDSKTIIDPDEKEGRNKFLEFLKNTFKKG